MNIYQATNLYLNMKIKSPNFSRLSLGLNSEVATLSQISQISTNINVISDRGNSPLLSLHVPVGDITTTQLELHIRLVWRLKIYEGYEPYHTLAPAMAPVSEYALVIQSQYRSGKDPIQRSQPDDRPRESCPGAEKMTYVEIEYAVKKSSSVGELGKAGK